MDTNIKDIKGYEGLYAVTTNGKVWSHPKLNGKSRRCGHWMKLHTYKGYVYANLCKNGKYKNHLVHRIVGEAFLSKHRNDFEINHLNGVKNDNRIENLEWCSRAKNCQHAYTTGLHVHNGLKGEENPRSKLSGKDVEYIRAFIEPTADDRKFLMDRFGIAKSTLSALLNNKTWRHV